MKSTFDALFEARQARQVVKDTLLKSLRRGADEAEIDALERTLELTTVNFKIALDAYAQINDFTRCTSEHQ